MFLKKNLLWIIFFGSLIGINEAFLGSLHIPFRSIVLSTITLALLTWSRVKIPQKGVSVMVILIAVLFKVNNIGYHSCSTNVLLCGPTAVLLLGIFHEMFYDLFLSKNTFRYINIILICSLTSIAAFTLFAVMNTYILLSWDTERLIDYVFVKASFTAIFSSGISILGLFIIRALNNKKLIGFNPYVINSILGSFTIIFWIVGTFFRL